MATEELGTNRDLDLSINSGTTTCGKNKAYEYLFRGVILFLSLKLCEQIEVKKKKAKVHTQLT